MFDLLKSLDASKYLTQIFRNVPDRFVETFVRFVCIEVLKKNVEMSRAFEDLDKTILVAVIYDLERLAQNHLQVCDWVFSNVRLIRISTVGYKTTLPPSTLTRTTERCW